MTTLYDGLMQICMAHKEREIDQRFVTDQRLIDAVERVAGRPMTLRLALGYAEGVKVTMAYAQQVEEKRNAAVRALADERRRSGHWP